MPKINFRNKEKTVQVGEGDSILEAALHNNIPIYHTCGGNASCSTCRVIVLKGAENLSPIEGPEAQILDSFDLKGAYRLGCQACVWAGEVEVEIPDRDKPCRPNKTPQIPE